LHAKTTFIGHTAGSSSVAGTGKAVDSSCFEMSAYGMVIKFNAFFKAVFEKSLLL
jgi:hypothetical protein